MSVTLHFKDGGTAVISNGANYRPFVMANNVDVDENWLEVIDVVPQGIVIVPVANLHYAEKGA